MPELESLGWLSSSEVVFALIAVGAVLLMVEVASPGGWIAGIAGVALLAVAGFALLSLPFSWIGLALIAVRPGAVSVRVSTGGSDYGAFGAAGVVSFRGRGTASVRGQDFAGTRRVRRNDSSHVRQPCSGCGTSRARRGNCTRRPETPRW